MGVLDQLTSALGGGQGGQQAGLLAAMMKMLNNPQIGGVSGLLAKLKSAGLGNAVSSWIGTGQNQPVTGQQLQSALGEENIDQVARDAGVSREEASSGLANLLPGLVDKLSPGGQIPDSVANAGTPGNADLPSLLSSMFAGQQPQ